MGSGGGMFNSARATVALTALKNARTQAVSTFGSNAANGGGGAREALPAVALPATGATAAETLMAAREVLATPDPAARWRGERGRGGGLYDAGVATFTGVTVNFTGNQVRGGFGGNGGSGRDAKGGNGGNGLTGGSGGETLGGDGGNGGESGIGIRGVILVDVSGMLSIDPGVAPRRAQAGQGHRRDHCQPGVRFRCRHARSRQ